MRITILIILTTLVFIDADKTFGQSSLSFHCPVLQHHKIDSSLYNQPPKPGLSIYCDSSTVFAPFTGKVSSIKKKKKSFQITLTNESIHVTFYGLGNCKVGENEAVNKGQAVGALDKFYSNYMLWLVITGPRNELYTKEDQLAVLQSYCSCPE